MRVRVLFFGQVKDLMGKSEDALNLPDGAIVADLVRHYEEQNPGLRNFLPAVAFSINQDFAGRTTTLANGDEVGILPPVSGGASAQPDASPENDAPHAFLVRESIDVGSRTATLRRPQDGAVIAFEGIVRDNTRGRRTLHLDYEAYEPMALKQMEALALSAMERFPVRDAIIIHRLGRLQIGETSVLILVASAHRAAGFEACRWLIDTLKRTVPIWKKEFFEDGAVWAAGEPFPEDIVQSDHRASGVEPA